MIIISKPTVQYEGDKAKLVTRVTVDDIPHDVYVRVDKEYAPYFCDDRCDAMLVGMIGYAMRCKHDIICEAPVTEELLFNIDSVLVPAMANNDGRCYRPNIKADTLPAIERGEDAPRNVGSSISCGVDSFHALANHYQTDHPDHDVTHLAIFNNGSFNRIYRNSGIDYVKERTFERAKKVADECGLPLLVIDSNFKWEIIQNHIFTHTYTDLYIVMSLQKLWSVYYYASGYDYNHFSLKHNVTTEAAHLDPLLVSCFSTSSLRIYTEGAESNRLQKTAMLAEFPPAQKHLHVCQHEAWNCGTCHKCMRTLLDLDATGNLEKFSESFDIDYYRENVDDYYKWLCRGHAIGNLFMEPAFKILYERHKEEFDETLKQYTLKRQVFEAEKNKRTADIWKANSRLFMEAIDRQAFNHAVRRYCRKHNIKHVAFFGGGEIRKFIASGMKEAEIPIDYVINDNGEIVETDLPIAGLNIDKLDKLPHVDLIIAANMDHGEQAAKTIARDEGLDSISGADFMRAMYEEMGLHERTRNAVVKNLRGAKNAIKDLGNGSD